MKKYTKKELKDIFTAKKQGLGKVPTRDEMGHREPIRRLYGGYNNFLRELGYLPNFLRNKNDYIKYIKKLHKELDKIPSQNDLIEKGIYLKSIYDMFGSYNNLIKEAGLIAREKQINQKSTSELLEDYISLCNELGRWATTREVQSIDIYENRFKSIVEVRKLVKNDERLYISDKTIKEATKRYSDKDIEAYLGKAIEKYGENISKTEFIKYLKNVEGPSINTIMKRFECTSFKDLIKQYRSDNNE